jgi:hypothetical protein
MLVYDMYAKTATEACSIVIVPQLAAHQVRSGTTVVELGQSAGAFGSLAGGSPPYTYSVSSGSLPPGTSLNRLALTGTFTSTGTYSFTTTVTDSLGATAAVSARYSVFGRIAFRPHPGQWDATCSGPIDLGCSAQVAYSGGTPGVKPTLTWSTADTNLHPVPVPTGASGQVDLTRPTVSGGAVHFNVLGDQLGTGGGLPWTGVVIVTVTDPVTHTSTTAHIFVIIYRP